MTWALILAVLVVVPEWMVETAFPVEGEPLVAPAAAVVVGSVAVVEVVSPMSVDQS